MRKLFLVLGASLLFATSVFAIPNYGHYHIKCYKCKDYAERKGGIGTCSGCIAWRMYSEELQDGWMVYHCEHGHKLLVSSKTEERK